MAVVGSQKIRPVRIVVGVGVRHGLAGDYFAAEVEIRGHAAQVAGRVVVVVELQPVVGGRFRVFLLRQLCTGKHRHCDTTKAKLVRSTPETFKGLGLSKQSAFCPPKAMLAGMITLLFSLIFFESLHFLKRNI